MIEQGFLISLSAKIRKKGFQEAGILDPRKDIK
jgi:hypothetical protein